MRADRVWLAVDESETQVATDRDGHATGGHCVEQVQVCPHLQLHSSLGLPGLDQEDN